MLYQYNMSKRMLLSKSNLKLNKNNMEQQAAIKIFEK